MLTESQKLEGLINLGIELNEFKDLDILMEYILREARRFVDADAGSIYIREGDRLSFGYSQNDTIQRRLPVGEKLPYHVASLPITTDSIAGYCAATGEILNIPDAYQIALNAPYRFRQSFDEVADYRTISILAIPLRSLRQDIVGVLQIINRLDESGEVVVFTDEDEKLLTHFAGMAAVMLERAQLTRGMILRMIRMAELRDPEETASHVNRVASYAVELYERWGRQHGLADKEIHAGCDTLRMAAMLHDVGKIAISDAILRKPDRLTAEEYETMKMHTSLGAALFGGAGSDLDRVAAEVALNHHEFWDGNGYPGVVVDATNGGSPAVCGKRGKEIPLFGRIVAICDVYDALMSRRPYKGAWEESQVIETLKAEAGRQFDPDLVDIFLASLPSMQRLRNRYPDKTQ